METTLKLPYQVLEGFVNEKGISDDANMLTLLSHLGEASEGNAELTELKNDVEMFVHLMGCDKMTYTVDELITEMCDVDTELEMMGF